MLTPLRIVSPYRPFAPESGAHLKLGPLDWVGALQMLRTSVTRSCRCETVAITDVDTSLPGPTFQYVTESRRLMAWILEVALCYVRSQDFDTDTVLLSPDLLVFKDLRPLMTKDFALLFRPQFPGHPILNAVQFWPVAKKGEIGRLYEQAYTLARSLPENYQRWGGDTEPWRQMFAPLKVGPVVRDGRTVARLLDCRTVMESFSSLWLPAMHLKRPPLPSRAVLDFKYKRKTWMRRYYDLTIGRAA